MADGPTLTKASLTHVTEPDGVHGQQVVAVAKLEVDGVSGGLQGAEALLLLLLLLLLGGAELLQEVLQEERVLTHPLDGLQQVGGQIQPVPQDQLLHLGPQGERSHHEEGGGERRRRGGRREERGVGGGGEDM